MMTKMRELKKILALCAALAMLVLAGCAQTEPAAEKLPPEDSAAADTAVLQAEGAAEGAEQESAPAQQAHSAELDAARLKESLPTPPDIDINSWEFLYASMDEGVGRYHPNIRTWENQYMDDRCMDQTIAFMTAAREAGHTVWINCGYRNFEYRLFWYEDAIYEYGSAFEAAKHVFPSGCSEHATGLAFDITDESELHANYYNMYDENMAGTAVYEWMAEHCTDYGFIVRYPEGHEEHFGRACNVGHFRYVGEECAKYISENDLCLEEFMALYGEYKY